MKPYTLLVISLLSTAFVILLASLYLYQNINFSQYNHRVPSIIPTSTGVLWQTYKNDQYGFEFEYPNGYLIENMPESDGGFQINIWQSKSEQERCSPIDPCYIAKIRIVVDNSLPSTDEVTFPLYFGHNKYRYFIDDIYNAGYYYLETNPRIYFLTMEKNLHQSIPEFSHILSTFKFTDK